MRTSSLVWLAFCPLILVVTAGFAAKPRALVIEDFELGVQNRFGGYRNTFEQAPSSATAERIPEARLGQSGLGLRLSCERKESGFCGYWIHFFDMRAPVRQFVDATPYSFLSFWVKGEEGGEQFTIRLADENWIAKEDSVVVGSVDQFLAGGVSNRWREVMIPLDDDYGLKLDKLGGITLEFVHPRESTIYVDNVSLKTTRSISRRSSVKKRDPRVVQPAPTPEITSLDRAIWLWSTEAMLDDPVKAEEFLLFCNDHGITQVWAQLLYRIKSNRRPGGGPQSTCVIQRASDYRRFLRSAHRVGVTVHALEGYPEHALREHHHIPLAIVEAVLSFNEQAEGAERFDGIHFDNEPHLLVGWHDPQLRRQILFEYLTLNAQCQQMVSEASPRIQFGVDIPFWLQDVNPRSGEAPGTIAFRGRTQAASFHLLEMLDNVGVMNYRDTAQGADGLVAHARDLLDRGDREDRVKLFMGVETISEEPMQFLFAVGRPRANFELAIRGEARDISGLSRLDQRRLRAFDDGQSVHVGIEIAKMQTPEERMEVASAISQVASVLGVDSNIDDRTALEIQDSLVKSLKKDAEWSDVRPCSVRDPKTGRRHLLVIGKAAMLGKITFADDAPDHFVRQIRMAEEQFTRHASYAGLAIHHYDSFCDLVHRNEGPSDGPPPGQPGDDEAPAVPPDPVPALVLTNAR